MIQEYSSSGGFIDVVFDDPLMRVSESIKRELCGVHIFLTLGVASRRSFVCVLAGALISQSRWS